MEILMTDYPIDLKDRQPSAISAKRTFTIRYPDSPGLITQSLSLIMADCPVRESIREIDDNSWLIGNKILLSRAPLSQCTWEDGNGGGYLISDATIPLPETRPLSDASGIKL